MLAILQERMLGVIRHLTHTFNIFLFFSGYVAVNLEPCFWTVLQPLQELLPQREKPRIHVSNLQTNVCQISNRKSNLAEADLHQCQKNSNDGPTQFQTLYASSVSADRMLHMNVSRVVRETDTCGVRAHTLTDWRLEPAP